MYYKTYGILNKTGFNVLHSQASTFEAALKHIETMDVTRFPFFAITEHLRAASPAHSISAGRTSDRKPFNTRMLIDYRQNPTQDPEAGAEYFGKLVSAFEKLGAQIDATQKD